jgi:nitroreductase
MKTIDTINTINTIEAIKNRYSCRAFTDKMPSDEHLQIIAEAAVAAPSAMNMQPWRVIVVKNKQLLAEFEAEAIKNIAALEDKSTYERVMSRGGKVYYNAPCQIIIPVDSPDINKWANIDCGIITQNVSLAAESLGINSLICGMIAFSFMGEKGQYFKERLGFPGGYDLGLSVLLGYADEAGVKAPHELDLSKISVVE